MKIIVFGATGRVGSCFVGKAVAAGHSVTAYVRNPTRLLAKVHHVIQGDIGDEAAIAAAMQSGCDAVVVCVGETALKPSTVVQTTIRSVIKAMYQAGVSRLIAVSGTAEMPNKTGFGKLYTAVLKRTHVGHAIKDHDAAFVEIQKSGLQWTLAGCNYLRSGPERGAYKTSRTFPGGFKIIHPPDVADFLMRELASDKNMNQVVGIWY